MLKIPLPEILLYAWFLLPYIVVAIFYPCS